jgi:2-hydroxy-4-carboxymuconate semialdehyde hemiacetal dehydrogenase
MEAGKYFEVEIPLCGNLADGERVLELQKQTRLVCMAGHMRRSNPSHQYVHNL